MKRVTAYIASGLIFIFSLGSCVFDYVDSISGNGNVTTESRDVEQFKAVRASGGLHVTITFDNDFAVEVEADENLHEVIHTSVNSGVLKIYSDRNIRNASSKHIRVTVPTLEEIDASSAAEIRCENVLSSDVIKVSASSAGDVFVEADALAVFADASSSGSIEIRGEAEEFEVDVSSAGSVDSDRLNVQNCKVRASSAGSASVWVTGELDASASSGSSIRYKGDPINRNVSSSSGGKISEK